MRSIYALAFLLLARVAGAQVQASTTQVAGTFPNFTSPGTWTGAQTFLPGALLDKGNIVFSVQAYGVDCGDNANNDTPFMQAAENAAGDVAGGLVFVPPNCVVNLVDDGTVVSGSVITFQGVTTKGASEGSSKIVSDTTGNPFIMFHGDSMPTCTGGSGAASTCMDTIKQQEGTAGAHGTRGPGCPCFFNHDCNSNVCTAPKTCTGGGVAPCSTPTGKGAGCRCVNNGDCAGSLCTGSAQFRQVGLETLQFESRKTDVVPVAWTGMSNSYAAHVTITKIVSGASKNYAFICGGTASSLDNVFLDVSANGSWDIGALGLGNCNENDWVHYTMTQGVHSGFVFTDNSSILNRIWGGSVQSRSFASCVAGLCQGGYSAMMLGAPLVCTTADQCPEAGIVDAGLYVHDLSLYQEDTARRHRLHGRKSHAADCTVGTEYPCCTGAGTGCPVATSQGGTVLAGYDSMPAKQTHAAFCTALSNSECSAANVPCACCSGSGAGTCVGAVVGDGDWKFITDGTPGADCSATGGTGVFVQEQAGKKVCTVAIQGNFFDQKDSVQELVNLRNNHDSGAILGAGTGNSFGDQMLFDEMPLAKLATCPTCAKVASGLCFDSDITIDATHSGLCFCDIVQQKWCQVNAPTTCGSATSCN